MKTSVTLAPDAWTDLGAAPLVVEYVDGIAALLQSSVAPVGTALQVVNLTQGQRLYFASGDRLYGRSLGGRVKVQTGLTSEFAAGPVDLNSPLDRLSLNSGGNGGGGAVGAGDASAANQVSLLNSLGGDGSNPPALAGTGVRGWLRGIYALLAGTITVQGAVTVSDGSGPLTVDGTVAVQATGQKTAAQSISVVQSSDGPIATAYGKADDAAIADGAAAGTGFTFFGLFKGMVVQLAAIRASVAGTLANSEVPVQGVIAMAAANTAYAAGRAVEIVATTAGDVTLTYADGSTRTRTFAVGLTRLPDAVTRWVLPSGSAFAGTICNLK